MKFKFILLILTFSIVIFFPSCESPSSPEKGPLINYFTANPSEIGYKEISMLSWSVSNATSVTINQGIGAVGATGEREVSPEEATTYLLTARNNDGQNTSSCMITVTARAVFELDGNLKRTYTSYHSPRFEGYVKNVGNATGYNVMVEITCYSDQNKTTIIDSASGFPGNLGNIKPGQRAYFEAIAFDCDSHNEIKAIDVEITWLTKSSAKISQIITIVFR